MPERVEQWKSNHKFASPGRLTNTARPFIQKQPRIDTGFKSPGGTEPHRQALHPETQKTHAKWMSRLTAMYSPPSSFWKISRISAETQSN